MTILKDLLSKVDPKNSWQIAERTGHVTPYRFQNLSPLLGGIALIPLDQAIGKIKNIYYCRFQDDWLILTKTKTALRKVIKVTHRVVNSLKFRLHPLKTYIGKISRGVNFLGYFMDNQKILPSCESLRRFTERAVQKVHNDTRNLYEDRQDKTNHQPKRRQRRMTPERDVSEYRANESPPTDADIRWLIKHLLGLVAHKPDKLAVLRRYVGQWTFYLRSGFTACDDLESSILACLPSLSSNWAMRTCSNGPSSCAAAPSC